MKSDLGLLALGESAGCACKAGWRVVETLRTKAGHSSLALAQLGLFDAGPFPVRDGLLSLNVASVDFIAPVARSPDDYGLIAAAHAMSDLYAVGAAPKCGLVIAVWPNDSLLEPALHRSVDALTAAANAAGCVILGGHTANSDQPLLGMCAIGERTAVLPTPHFQPGDKIYLTKPLGSGIVVGAIKQGQCSSDTEHEALLVMREQNVLGLALNAHPLVKLVTDITGFGLCGQLSRLASASGFSVIVERCQIPLICGVKELMLDGCGTQAAEKNWGDLKSYLDCQDWQSILICCDPQTNGPLLFVADADFPGTFDLAKGEGVRYFEIGQLASRSETSSHRAIVVNV